MKTAGPLAGCRASAQSVLLGHFKKCRIRLGHVLEGRRPLRPGARRAPLHRGGYGFFLYALSVKSLFSLHVFQLKHV